jgi:hypothetical protein
MGIFTELGMDTGFPPHEGDKHFQWKKYEARIRGKMAHSPFPYIIKEGKICRDLPNRIETWNWTIDHVYVTVRSPNLLAAAEARVAQYRWREGRYKQAVRLVEGYERRLQKKFYALCVDLGRLDIPHTIVTFPEWASDLELSYKKFGFLMDKHGITFEKYKRACEKLMDPEEVHKAMSYVPYAMLERNDP